MHHERTFKLLHAALLLGLISRAIADPHGTENTSNADLGGMGEDKMNMETQGSSKMDSSPTSYFRYLEHGGWIYGHIFAMVLAWTVVLPLGKNL
jgi:hypothetical protein